MNKKITTNLAVLLTMCCACTKAPIDYHPMGEVSIRPTASAQTLPAMTYYFYATTSTGWGAIMRAGDESGNYGGLLPTGVYDYIAVGATADVVLSGMDHFDTAVAQGVLDATATRAGEAYVFRQPGMLYVLDANRIDVPADGNTVWQTPTPQQLTHTVSLQIALPEALQGQVASIAGIIRGVMPQVNLATRAPQNGEIEDMSMAAIAFDTSPSDGGFLAQINLFGIADPGYGNNYTNRLTLDVAHTDGTVETIDLDLTTLITEIIAQYQGVIPLELPLEIDIHQTEIGLQAEVIGWVNSGESEKEI